MRLAVAYTVLNREEDALTLLSEALRSNPAFWHGHYIIATVLKTMSQDEKSLDHVSKVLDQTDIDNDLRLRAETLRDELADA